VNIRSRTSEVTVTIMDYDCKLLIATIVSFNQSACKFYNKHNKCMTAWHEYTYVNIRWVLNF